ncbi:MAG: GAF domain-containing protein [Anaerolineales bacterium]|nr:GAF domain-containing protein [Anaerolineales bacterium]
MQKEAIETYFKDTCSISGADWAVLVERGKAAWALQAAFKLGGGKTEPLIKYVNSDPIDDWLCGVLVETRVRSKVIPANLEVAGKRLYAFPFRDSSLVLVGAVKLDAKAKRLWRLVVGFIGTLMVSTEISPEAIGVDVNSDIPYDAPRALQTILSSFIEAAACQGGWLAILRGDTLDVQAQKGCIKCPDTLLIEENDLLLDISNTLLGMVVDSYQPQWKNVLLYGPKKKSNVWGCLPLVKGRRLIGLVAVWRGDTFLPYEWQRLSHMAARAAVSVDIIEAFAEMTGHLHRLALLNDVAMTVSSARNLEQIVRRVFGLMVRTFGTELIALTLLSLDEKMLREYRNYQGRVLSRLFPRENHSLGPYIKKGKLVRSGDIAELGYTPVHDGIRSVLVAPFKHHGRTIGVLTIESIHPDAFSIYDEHLMVVISSNLAGLVEYGRLLEETESRARNLGLIHDVVQQVIGLTNKREVAQITADLLAQYLGYELAAVLLADDDGMLTIGGFGGASAALVMDALARFQNPIGGITGYVLSTGKSLIVNDVSQNKIYQPVEGWDAQSELCVALKDDNRILGLIDVESSKRNAFSHNDLMALESMAGILVGVVFSADQYQKLRATIEQLRITQDELQTRIEAQRAAENRLVQAAKLAAVGEMAAGVAHELNNPLTTVSGFTELVLEDLPEDCSQRSDLELVLKEARRARDVVRRLLDFARQSESMHARADLNEIIDDVITLSNHYVHTSGVQLTTDLDPKLPWVSMDRNQIKQVLLNLVHNALQAMPSGGDMRIQTYVSRQDGKDWACIRIWDTGMGISPKDRDRIFEPFFTTRSGVGGTGLGLSVSYGIITNHGGFIEVDSEPGEGSKFTVWLPIQD